MKTMLDLNSELQERIDRILKQHIRNGADSRFVRDMARQLDGNIHKAISVLEQLQQGLTENAPSN
jgi:hypothetical protein